MQKLLTSLLALVLGGATTLGLGATSANAAAGVSDPAQNLFNWFKSFLPDVKDSENHWLGRLLGSQGHTLIGSGILSTILYASGKSTLGSVALLSGVGLTLYNYVKGEMPRQFAAVAGGASPTLSNDLMRGLSNASHDGAAAPVSLTDLAANPMQAGGALNASEVAAEQVMANAAKEAHIHDASARGTKNIISDAKLATAEKLADGLNRNMADPDAIAASSNKFGMMEDHELEPDAPEAERHHDDV